MHFQILAGALALAGSTAAFSDSSPWVLLSSASSKDGSVQHSVQSSSQAYDFTKSFLQGCPTDQYLFVNQPGLNAADFQSSKALHSLSLAKSDSRTKSEYIVSEVLGDVSYAGLRDIIKTSCKDASVKELAFASLASDDRASVLSKNDAELDDKLKEVMQDGSYTVLFLSTPGEPSYEADFVDSVQMDLKRHVQDMRRDSNQTNWDNLPLFEKYQFFTPGIFMGIIVAIVLLSILGVGIKALSSLEVSYGAFEKDMGPAAQKKQQ